jgi:GT2 family glycosyltransferase
MKIEGLLVERGNSFFMMNAEEAVAIILLNYGRVEKTLACLDSLLLLQGVDYRIFVIDNASPDDSLLRLQARLAEQPGEFTLIESQQNLGYSGGCNLGIRAARALLEPPAYIWLLNNDTTVEGDSLIALLMESWRTGGGLAGSLLLYPDGSYQQVGTRFNRWTGRARGYRENDVRDGMPVEMLTGASMLIPMKVVARVGLLNERFFLYFEDGEYSLRCANAGFPLTVSLNSRVYHHEGASTGKSSPATQYYYQRNRLKLLYTVVSPLQKTTIGVYALFRWLRAILKCLPVGKPGKQDANRLACRIYSIALQDFWKDIDGQCPHIF